ncbi:MAG: 50S ribosomal protein L10 [Planctomycetia bacterium]|nr:50S ribosomal protein L10 [Planctomycetia bacterium]
MSKIVKDMLVDDLKKRLGNVSELVVVSLGRLDAQKTSQLRHALRKKKIHLQMIKNSLARRATLDTPLAPAFVKTEGMLAVAWGGEDVVDLAKELDRLSSAKEFEGFECRGGALDGAPLDAGDIKRVAKWPTRAEQLSLLSGQISGLASTLSGQVMAVGGMLAGQISSRVEDLEKAAGGDAAAS